MTDYIFFLISIPIIYFINNFFINKKLFINTTGDKHQRFTSKKTVPLSGGLFVFITFILLFHQLTLINKLIILFFYLIGFFSDIKIFKSPLIRLFFQILMIFIFVKYNGLVLENTRILILDSLLSHQIVNTLFLIFCFTIIINGSNFADGVNCNIIGYYLIITLILYKLELFVHFNFTLMLVKNWILILSIIFILNFSNKLYLGDNGSYFLGFLFSYLLIDIYLNNQYLSPFFIILLLWYPAFENLFSLIRKINFGKSPLKPDQNHLHQLIFFFLKKKILFNAKYINSITGIIILLYNLIIFNFSILEPGNTQYQIILIVISILLYCIVYSRLFKYKYSNLFK